MSFAGVLQGVHASGLFSPSSISGLVLDLDGDKGITLATGVSAWADQQIATPYNFSKATTTQQPAYTATDPNLHNHGSVNFDGAATGADNMLSTGTDPLRPAGGFLVAVAGKFVLPASGFKYISVKWSGSIANRYWLSRMNSTGTVQVLIRNAADTAWQSVITVGTVPVSGRDVLMFGWDGATTGFVWINGAEETFSVTDAYDAGTAQLVSLGRVASDSAQMDVARVLGYDQPVIASNRARLHAYLKTRYSI